MAAPRSSACGGEDENWGGKGGSFGGVGSIRSTTDFRDRCKGEEDMKDRSRGGAGGRSTIGRCGRGGREGGFEGLCKDSGPRAAL